MVGISIGITLALAAAFVYIGHSRRDTPQIEVRPTLLNLSSLGKDETPLVISNHGNSSAHGVLVSMRIRNTMFEFDPIESLQPSSERALTWNERAGRFKVTNIGVATNWLRTAVHSAVLDASSDLRIPIAIHYRDDKGTERTAFQVLHCDEQLRIHVTDS